MIQQSSSNKHHNDDDEYYYSNFIYSIKAKTTKTDYTFRLKYFMQFLGIKEGKYSLLIENNDKKSIEDNIKSFLIYLRKERKLTYHSASHYLNSIRKFYYVNSEFDLRWKLIRMYLGDEDNDDDDNHNSNNKTELETKQGEEEDDRPYTREEIQTMLKTANDIRSKIIILLISSSGIRMGAIPSLKLGNLVKIEKYGLYQITVYHNSKKHNYKTFCSPECTNVIDSYLAYRKHADEDLKEQSPLLRERFNPADSFKVNNPKHIGVGLVKYLVNEVLTKYSALKQKLEYDYENKRKVGKNSTMMTHALRKFFDTESRKAGMYPDFVELLMGHKLPGVRSHYFKPETNTLLEGTAECKGYIHAINDLTINEENRLTKVVKELKEKDDYKNYIIDKKMQEKEEQIKELMVKVEKLTKVEQEFKQTKKESKEYTDRFAQIELQLEKLFAKTQKEKPKITNLNI